MTIFLAISDYVELPGVLAWLWLVPLLFGLWLLSWWWQGRTLARFGNEEIVKQLMPKRMNRTRLIQALLFCSAIALFILAYSNPRWGKRTESVEVNAIDLYIAIDVSRSMYGNDLKPNRMEVSQRFARKLLTKLDGDRVGILIFAGSAFMQMPLTDDYLTADFFLKNADPTLTDAQGTDMGGLIELARKAFATDDPQNRALVIITDGEDHDDKAIAAAEKAHQEDGVYIFTVGAATPQGASLRDPRTGQFITDRSGNKVVSSLNESLLKTMAAKSRGTYFRLTGNDDKAVDALLKRLNKLESRATSRREYDEYESYFGYPLGLGIALLLVSFLLNPSRTRKQFA